TRHCSNGRLRYFAYKGESSMDARDRMQTKTGLEPSGENVDSDPQETLGSSGFPQRTMLWGAPNGIYGISTDFVETASLPLDSKLLDDRSPLRHLSLEVGSKLGRRGGRHVRAHLFEFLLQRRLRERRDRVVMDFLDDARRCFRRHEQSVPHRHLKPRHAGF